MNISFVSLGSVGDVAPLIAVAERLQARGHACELLTNEEFVPRARQRGLQARAVAPPIELLRRVPRLDEYLYCAHAAIARELAPRASRLSLLVNTDRYCASNLVAEKHGLSVARLHLSPFKLRPYDGGRVPSYDLFAKDPRVLAFVNQVRSSLGLDDVATAFHDEAYVVRHVAAFPSWFCPAPPAGAPPLDFVGFPLPPEREPLPPALRAFIQRRGRPLVFTFGSANEELSELVERAERACKELRLPGVLLCARGVGQRRSSEQLLLCPFVPLGALLPEARLLVHHGGIGTTARALEAGVPQLILPGGFDQPDNGARCAALGAGAVLDRAQATPRRLVQSLRRLLDDAGVSQRVARLRDDLAPAQGIERLADSLEASRGARAPARGASGACLPSRCAEAAIAG